MPFYVAMERLNKLRVECYDVKMICDGKKVHGAIPSVDRSRWELPAPAKITERNALLDNTMSYSLTMGLPDIRCSCCCSIPTAPTTF